MCIFVCLFPVLNFKLEKTRNYRKSAQVYTKKEIGRKKNKNAINISQYLYKLYITRQSFIIKSWIKE